MTEQEIKPGSRWTHRETGRRATVVGLSTFGEWAEYPELVVYRRDDSPDRWRHHDRRSFLRNYRPVVFDEPKRLHVSPIGLLYDATVLNRGPEDKTIELNPDGTWREVEG